MSISLIAGEQLIKQIEGLKRRLRELDRQENAAFLPVSTSNVSSPPTDAELDTAFGTPATVGAGFLGLVDDAGAGSAVYLVGSDGTNWWYLAMTKAV
jgi:hypothetical protein